MNSGTDQTILSTDKFIHSVSLIDMVQYLNHVHKKLTHTGCCVYLSPVVYTANDNFNDIQQYH